MESATSQSKCTGDSCESSNSKVLLLMAVFLSLLFGYFMVRKVIAYLKSKNRFRHSKNFSEDGRSNSEIQKGDKMQFSTYDGLAETLETRQDAVNTESEKQPNYITENIEKITHFPTKLALKLQEYLMKTGGVQENDLENPQGAGYDTNKNNQMPDNEKGQAKDNEVDINNEIFYSEENGTGTVRVISDLASPKDQNLRDHDELNSYS